MSETVERWIAGYRRAWESNDPEEIGALFTEDAAYYTAPFREPARGRDQIVARWIELADAPGSTTFTWSLLAEHDALAFVQGETDYGTTKYSNLWVIRFAQSGEVTEFTEWWMDQAEPQPTP